MNARPYKIIFILLIACSLFLLLLQGYWIRNFYIQKTEEFNRAVYAALDQLSTKLQERKSLQTLKMTYFIQNGDTIAKTPSRRMSVVSEQKIKIINKNTSHVQTKETTSNSNFVAEDSVLFKGNNQNVDIILNGKKATLTVFNDSNKQGLAGLANSIKETDPIKEHNDEITKLVDKMVTEIKMIDAETENVDSVNALIKKTLNNKGLFLPFEFSLQNQHKNEKTVLTQSKYFDNKAPGYKTDLSANKIIPTGEFLFLQFPNQKDFVVTAMRGTLILSGIFSLVIIGVFYYVIRLILTQKKLSEIKNDFINNMTHELKTPIATNSLALDAITNPFIKNDEAKFKDYVRILKEENEKLNVHVERVLQMALLDKGELPLNKQIVDLKVLMFEAIESYKLQIADVKAEVVFDSFDDPIQFSGDKQHLKTVFSNMLDNALKYSCDACVIHIKITEEKEYIFITVKDNGIGIDKAHRDKIFDKFYRAQGGNLHDVKGFGLGLCYVRSVVESHGGTIDVKSELGKGSEFTITFKNQL